MPENEPSSPEISEYQSIASQWAQAENNKTDTKKHKSTLQLRKELELERWNEGKVLEFKVAHGLLVGFFLWLLAIHVAGVYFFTKGFLLTRLVLEHKSECAVLPTGGSVDAAAAGAALGTPGEGCWHPKTFDKAVVIIIDALRYDFTVPYEAAVSEGGDGDKKQPHLFHNAFPVLHETAVEHPENAFLLPFISDPPTTTLQRLKGLTTGTLPTFIDAGSNFAGTAIDEDNLVAQLKAAGKTLVHLGDDTWHSLFPGYFDEGLTHAYDSFNVWDLHTVDNGVIEHVFPLLQPSNAGKWDVIFGHFLGVDHAGHRYGPDHPAMTTKLQQMDKTIRDMIAAIDDDTLLVVMGDHGMDAKGDHGGESDDEVEAALWMYSKKGVFGRTKSGFIQPPKTAKERPVPQIDLVPTLSLLLGMPIPFNNLGSPIEEAFSGADGKDWKNLAAVNRLTSAQIKRYQHEYATAKGIENANLGPLATLSLAEQSFASASEAWAPSLAQLQETDALFRRYQRETLSICRGLWAEFDVPSMMEGIALLFAGLVVLVLYARGFQGGRVNATPTFLRRIVAGSLAGAAIGVTGGAGLLSMSLIDAVVLFTSAGSIIGAATTLGSLKKRITSIVPNSLWGWLAFIVTISQAIGFASNSYTIWEDEMLLFFLTTFGVLAGCSSLRQLNPADRVLGVYHSACFVLLTRVVSLSRLCREEQMPLCRSTYYASATSSTSAPWQLLIPFIVALILPSIIKSYYSGTLSYEGSAVFWIGFAFRMSLLLVAIYWAIDAADGPINSDK